MLVVAIAKEAQASVLTSKANSLLLKSLSLIILTSYYPMRT